MDTIRFYDTSALLGGAPIEKGCFISSCVIDELEHIKTSATKDLDVKYKARVLVRKLMKDDTAMHQVFSEKDIEKIMKKNDFLAAKNDSRIICEALLLNKKYHVVFITQDACQYLIVKERFPELEVEYFEEEKNKENLWKGYKEVCLSPSQLDSLYSNPEDNILSLETNEYCIIREQKSPEEISDIIKWTGEKNCVIDYKPLRSDYFGKIAPRNPEQEMFFDMLQNRKIPIKLCRGRFGSGKTFLALVHAMNLLQAGNFKKLVYIRNNIEVFGSKELGALPGLIFWPC